MDTTEVAQEPRPAPIWLQTLYQLAAILPTLVYLAVALPGHTGDLLHGSVLLFVVAVAVVDLIPVPGWGGAQLSLSFPLLLGVAIIFEPAVATAIALVGSADPRELRREVTVIRALFNRSQMALSILAGSVLFNLVAHQEDEWYKLLLGVALAASAAYIINAGLVAIIRSLSHGISISQVLVRMHGSAPIEFLASYIGLGLFGAVIAQFYREEGFWSVVVFLGPLVFARQMYFRSRALADRQSGIRRLATEPNRHLPVKGAERGRVVLDPVDDHSGERPAQILADDHASPEKLIANLCAEAFGGNR